MREAPKPIVTWWISCAISAFLRWLLRMPDRRIALIISIVRRIAQLRHAPLPVLSDLNDLEEAFKRGGVGAGISRRIILEAEPDLLKMTIRGLILLRDKNESLFFYDLEK